MVISGCGSSSQDPDRTTQAAGLSCSPGPATSATSDAPSVGVQFHGTWADYTDDQRARVLDLMAAAGVTSVRVDATWAALQPRSSGQWAADQLDVLDTVVDMAVERHLSVLVTLLVSPAWAGGGDEGTRLPDDPADYASAIGFLADRYAGRVEAWEIWNEENSDEFAQGADPVGYTQLLTAAYPAVKAADPQALVVFGGTQYNDDSFVAAAYTAGARGSFDVMATHPYPAPSDAAPTAEDDGTEYSLGHVAAVRDVMDRNGDSAVPIWFTEVGWSSHENSGGEEAYERGVTEEQQGDYLVDTLDLVRSDFPYVQRVFWYAERDRTTGAPQISHFGLLTTELDPKPAAQDLACYIQDAR